MRLNAKAVAVALGGVTNGNDRVLAPGPGRSAHDDSLIAVLVLADVSAVARVVLP